MMEFRLPFRSRGKGPGSKKGFLDPVARRTSPRKSVGCGVAFFGVFLLAGLAFSMVFVVPAIRVVKARSWDPVPCEILSSHVESHPGDDSTTYSVEVRYRYQVDGLSYEGDRYQFLGGSSSGYDSKQEVVDGLPAGTVTECWVDPEDPSSSVLDRSFSLIYLVMLFPLIFVAIGAGGIVMTLLGARRMGPASGKAAAPQWLPKWSSGGGAQAPAAGPPEAITPEAITPGSTPSFASAGSFMPAATGSPGDALELETKHSPLGKLVIGILIAVFWNGIVSVFVWQWWKSWQAGSPDGCLTLFLIPFVLVGLAFLINIPYQFLALFNPRPRLTLRPGRLVPGGSAELTWGFEGSTGRIRRLQIVLEGREEADYTRGTNRTTARETFATLPVTDVTGSSEIAFGRARLEIPAGTMHSFDAPDNRIVWALKLQGTIRMWPDVMETLPVVIEPTPVERTER